MPDPANTVRTPNLPSGTLIEVLGHIDAGGGSRALARQSIADFLAYLHDLVLSDPSGLAGVRADLTTEVGRAEAAEAALSTAISSAASAAAAAASAAAATSAALTAREQVIVDAAVSSVLDMMADLGIEKRRPMPYLYDGTAGGAVPSTNAVLYVFWVWGQSLALGATTGSPISTAPVYFGRALMPDTGLHVGSGIGSLINLVEGTYLGAVQETVCASFANHLIRDLDAAMPGTKPNVAMFVGAVGGESYYQLKQGSTIYTGAVAMIDAIARLVEPTGVRVIAHVIGLQGENDVYVYGEHYDDEMVGFQRDLSTDIRRVTGQCEEPLLFLSQVDRVLGAGATKGQPLQMAQIRAASRSPYVKVVGPKYDCPRNSADHVHLTSFGSYVHGMTIARAVKAELFGTGWRPLMPTDAYFVEPPAGKAARIVLPMHVPVEPLVLDTSGSVITAAGAAAAPGYGFHVYDDAGNELTISAVSVLQAYTSGTDGSTPALAIDLAAKPPGPVLLTYAEKRDSSDDANTDDGPVTGARGCVRDSAAHAAISDGSTHCNWMVHWHGWVKDPIGRWAAYTPTLSVGSGSLTAASATGRYVQVGKTVYFTLAITITTNGSAAVYINAGLPSAAVADTVAFGHEKAITGKMLQGMIFATATVAQVVYYDNTYPGQDGATLVLSGSYEAA